MLTSKESQSIEFLNLTADFLYLNKYPLFEEAVKMVVLSPLLTSAGFYRMPFRIMVTNGSHFMFLKLMLGETKQYAISDEFSLLKRGNDLYTVLGILKNIGNEIS